MTSLRTAIFEAIKTASINPEAIVMQVICPRCDVLSDENESCQG